MIPILKLISGFFISKFTANKKSVEYSTLSPFTFYFFPIYIPGNRVISKKAGIPQPLFMFYTTP